MNFRKQHSIEPTPMQLAPLVDVLFLLVIFFAVTSHYAKNEQVLDISVPAADEKEKKEEEEKNSCKVHRARNSAFGSCLKPKSSRNQVLEGKNFLFVLRI